MRFPRVGYRWSWIWLGCAATLLLAVSLIRYRQSQALRRTNSEVIETTDLLGALARLAAERRAREFAYVRWITRSDPVARRRAAAATAGVERALERLRGLVQEDPDFTRQTRVLAEFVGSRTAAINDTTPPTDVDAALRAAEGFGDSVETILAEIEQKQLAILEAQRSEADRVGGVWRRWMPAGTGSALLVLVLAAASLAGHNRERRDSRRRLEASEARFRAAAEGGFDAFLLLHDTRRPGGRDPEMHVVELNERAAALLGAPRAELLGRSLRELHQVFCATDDEFLATAALVMSSGKPREETIPQSQGNRTRWLRRLIVPTTTGLAVSCRDVTEEHELRDQLAHSQKLDALGRMAAGVAHDFNNILTVLRSECDLVLEEPALPTQTRADVNEMIRAVDRAASLTQRLLAFSRKQVSAPRPIAVDRAIEEMRVFLIRMMPQNITLELESAPDLEPIEIDPVHFDQILLNLAANARDAMPDGGHLHIQATLVHLRDALAHLHGDVPVGRWVRIRVTDVGHGMPPAVLKRLFEPFFTTKAQGLGTGLGLATVHGAVQQAGGHVTVESEVGRGSMFALYFPARPFAELGPVLEGPKAPPSVPLTGTILLAEDEPAVRAVMERILKRAGYQVIAAPSGEEAMQLFARHLEEIDALVTDMVMPGMSGLELAARVNHVNPGLPVLFVSGYVGDAVQVPPGAAESGRFLQKPFTSEALLERLRRLGAA